VLSHERLEAQYFAAMRETLEGILEEGEIWLEAQDLDVSTIEGLPVVQQ